jgi:hypothetical protein
VAGLKGRLEWFKVQSSRFKVFCEMKHLAYVFLAVVVFAFSDARPARAQVTADKVVVSYPSKSITNFRF